MKNRDNITICIVLSTFDKKISHALLKGATQKFIDSGCLRNNLIVYEVPGAFEIPGTIKSIINSSYQYMFEDKINLQTIDSIQNYQTFLSTELDIWEKLLTLKFDT